MDPTIADIVQCLQQQLGHSPYQESVLLLPLISDSISQLSTLHSNAFEVTLANNKINSTLGEK